MQKDGRTPSMRDVAREAGVHVTTVSLALRNSPQLPVKTRERIQAIATKMGYRPNPLVVALVEQRRKSSFRASLAFISRQPTDPRLVNRRYTESIYRHAARRAGELGFSMDAFDLADYGDDPRRLQKTLRHRNIHGLVIAPLPRSTESYDFDWEHLAVVAIGRSLDLPGVDRVDSDFFGGSLLAMGHCEEMGYRRPGFVSLKRTDERTQGRWRGGYLSYLPKRKDFVSQPPLITNDENFEAEATTWFRSCKPDVILANSSGLEACESVLSKVNSQDRPDFLRLNIHEPKNPMMGIYTGVEIRARLAVEVVAAKLYRNEVGCIEYPQEIITPAIWHPGKGRSSRIG